MVLLLLCYVSRKLRTRKTTTSFFLHILARRRNTRTEQLWKLLCACKKTELTLLQDLVVLRALEASESTGRCSSAVAQQRRLAANTTYMS